MSQIIAKTYRCIGHQLSKMIDKSVIVLGKITEMADSKKELIIETTDGISVTIEIPDDIQASVNDFIEIHGTAVSAVKITCNFYVVFPSDMADDFEGENYNNIIKILYGLGNRKWKVNPDDDGP